MAAARELDSEGKGTKAELRTHVGAREHTGSSFPKSMAFPEDKGQPEPKLAVLGSSYGAGGSGPEEESAQAAQARPRPALRAGSEGPQEGVDSFVYE